MSGKAGASGGGNRTFGASPKAKAPVATVRPAAGANTYWSKWRKGMTPKRISNALLRHYKDLRATVPDDVHQRLVGALFNRLWAACLYDTWIANGMNLDPPRFPPTKRSVVDEITRADGTIAVCWKAIDKGTAAAPTRQAADPKTTEAADPLAQFKRPALRSVR